MEEVLQVLIAVGGLFVLMGFTADAVARAAIRRKIADKELTPDQIEALLKRRVDPDSVLKWAILTTAVGLSFAVVQLVPSDMRDEPIVIGLVLVFAGAALFLYRAWVRRHPTA